MDNFNQVLAASLEGSAWFRRSLQVVTQLDHSSDFEESSQSDKSSVPEQASPATAAKSSQFSIPAVLIMAEVIFFFSRLQIMRVKVVVIYNTITML